MVICGGLLGHLRKVAFLALVLFLCSVTLEEKKVQLLIVLKLIDYGKKVFFTKEKKMISNLCGKY